MAKSKAERGRFSSRKKVEAMLRVLHGEGAGRQRGGGTVHLRIPTQAGH
jgi:hypothetical protein